MSADTAYLRGLANVRDLGGLPVQPSGSTRSGVLLRSDAPHPDDMSPAGIAWPPATVIDLRTRAEDVDDHPLAVQGATVHSVPMLDPAQITGERLPESLAALYLSLVDGSAPTFRRVVELAASAPGPVLVQCAAGKDRTGVAIALLLLLAGVPEQAVVTDYVATHPNMPAVMARLAVRRGRAAHPHEAPGHLMGAPEDAIAPVVHRFTTHPGGVEGWAQDAGVGAEVISAWRERFIAG